MNFKEYIRVLEENGAEFTEEDIDIRKTFYILGVESVMDRLDRVVVDIKKEELD